MTSEIEYGPGLPNESELRLVGDLSGGKRAIELGVRAPFNAIAFAHAGAKAIAVDPDQHHIESLRTHAQSGEVRVECHVADLADLGFATSGSVECVIARDSLEQADDLGRTLRQINRVLQASRPLIITVTHPAAVPPYGSTGRTISDWFTVLSRNNFRVDQILELGTAVAGSAPSTLLVRARKQGD